MKSRFVKTGCLALVAAAAAVVATRPVHGAPRDSIAHVLLISIDGLHANDLAWYLQDPPDGSALAYLSAHGRTYTQASATRPSDSFPGMLAMISGGTPRSTGVYYDDGWDRTLAASSGTCPPAAPGTRARWKQNLDIPYPTFATFADYQSFWQAGAPPGAAPEWPLNAANFPRNPATNCSRVFPHMFPQVNNVFELVKAAGGRTAWSDKHPAYEFLMGMSGTGIDDLYSPEIATPIGTAPAPLTAVITDSFQRTMDWDDLKVAAIVNEIYGLDHSGTNAVGTPALFGMNFQEVSVAQKLDMSPAGGDKGGYLDANGTPSGPLVAALRHVDDSLGSIVQALRRQNLLGSTCVIISAKHGNSPVDPSTLVRANPDALAAVVNGVQAGLLGLVSADTGPLIWLKDASRTQDVVIAFKAADHNVTRIDAAAPGDGVLWGDALKAVLGDNSRTPDIVLLPIPGTVYTTSVTKIADHGSFYDNDTHVALLVSHGSIQHSTISDPVETRQIACTILTSLNLNCGDLMSQQTEPSGPLPVTNVNGNAPHK